MAAITTLTVGNAVEDNNSFESKGLKSFTQIYAATSIPDLRTGAKEQHVMYAQLTGAMTINATTVVSRLNQLDRVVFHLSSDGTSRTVTFGTGFVATATIAPAINKDARIEFEYDGAALREVSRWIGA